MRSRGMLKAAHHGYMARTCVQGHKRKKERSHTLKKERKYKEYNILLYQDFQFCQDPRGSLTELIQENPAEKRGTSVRRSSMGAKSDPFGTFRRKGLTFAYFYGIIFI
jgi:hypothetical protein